MGLTDPLIVFATPLRTVMWLVMSGVADLPPKIEVLVGNPLSRPTVTPSVMTSLPAALFAAQIASGSEIKPSVPGRFAMAAV